MRLMPDDDSFLLALDLYELAHLRAALLVAGMRGQDCGLFDVLEEQIGEVLGPIASADEPPPVITGPGGDFQRGWPRDSRPHTRELTGRTVEQIREEAVPLNCTTPAG